MNSNENERYFQMMLVNLLDHEGCFRNVSPIWLADLGPVSQWWLIELCLLERLLRHESVRLQVLGESCQYLPVAKYCHLQKPFQHQFLNGLDFVGPFQCLFEHLSQLQVL
uniref:Uncharacterized protein n=1 Tax=Cacopsylla melanoneura TaxID=428564 RepID=A0A8D9DY31_9HEMI